MTTFQLIIFTVVLAVVFEAATLFCRFGLNLQSTRDTRWLARWTGGLRVHHGYVGAAALGPFMFAPIDSLIADIGIIVAGALILSDLAHHFLVLWPLTGSPQFDLMYREPSVALPAEGVGSTRRYGLHLGDSMDATDVSECGRKVTARSRC